MQPRVRLDTHLVGEAVGGCGRRLKYRGSAVRGAMRWPPAGVVGGMVLTGARSHRHTIRQEGQHRRGACKAAGAYSQPTDLRLLLSLPAAPTLLLPPPPPPLFPPPQCPAPHTGATISTSTASTAHTLPTSHGWRFTCMQWQARHGYTESDQPSRCSCSQVQDARALSRYSLTPGCPTVAAHSQPRSNQGVQQATRPPPTHPLTLSPLTQCLTSSHEVCS